MLTWGAAFDHFVRALKSSSFSAPLKAFGEGDFKLSVVKEIDGTDSYMKSSEKAGNCQNKESQENCFAREYLNKGLETCKCVLFKLRNFSKTVS